MKRRHVQWIATAVLLAGAGALLLAERRAPLRPVVQPKSRRDLRNGLFALLSGLTITLLQDPLVGPLSRRAEARRWGLLGRLPLPRWLHTAAAVLLMDYSLYVWHVMTHRVPFLWRFHRPHHADLEMDASTALRFHFGEMALSVPWRAAQVVLIGAGPQVLKIWQQLTLVCILFHHSNLKLPAAVDRAVAKVLVTPRLHEIHHSTFVAERDTNWSSGLSLWDRLHGTFQATHLADTVTIGDPDLRRDDQLGAAEMLALPFRPAQP